MYAIKGSGNATPQITYAGSLFVMKFLYGKEVDIIKKIWVCLEIGYTTTDCMA